MGFLTRLFGMGGAKEDSGPELIAVAAVSQEYAWLEAHPCEKCGGRWSVMEQSVPSIPGQPEHLRVDQLEVSCDNCGFMPTFRFQVDTHSPQYLAEQQEMMQELISVASVPEEYAWLEANPCECGGRWDLVAQSVTSRPGLPEHLKVDQLEVTCDNCGRMSVYLFQVDTHSPQYLAEQQAMMKELFGDDAKALFGGGEDDGEDGSSNKRS
jgi:hypothetical protein